MPGLCGLGGPPARLRRARRPLGTRTEDTFQGTCRLPGVSLRRLRLAAPPGRGQVSVARTALLELADAVRDARAISGW